MRISDWSSDVCSSDRPARGAPARRAACRGRSRRLAGSRHALGRDGPFLRGDAEGRIGAAIAAIAASALDDLEEEALAEGGAVELEVLAHLVAVVEHVFRAQPLGEVRGPAEPGLEVVVVVRGDLARQSVV